jgi:hypothetical protein
LEKLHWRASSPGPGICRVCQGKRGAQVVSGAWRSHGLAVHRAAPDVAAIAAVTPATRLLDSLALLLPAQSVPGREEKVKVLLHLVGSYPFRMECVGCRPCRAEDAIAVRTGPTGAVLVRVRYRRSLPEMTMGQPCKMGVFLRAGPGRNPRKETGHTGHNDC